MSATARWVAKIGAALGITLIMVAAIPVVAFAHGGAGHDVSSEDRTSDVHADVAGAAGIDGVSLMGAVGLILISGTGLIVAARGTAARSKCPESQTAA